MSRHTAARAAYRRSVHEQLAKGLTNLPDGRFARPSKSSDKESEVYAARAAKNTARNKRNRMMKATKRERWWNAAYAHAKLLLEREGDSSEPLEAYVRQFLYVNKRTK